MSNTNQVFRYGQRKFIVDYQKHFEVDKYEGKAFLQDIDTGTKFSIPMKAMDGLFEFYQTHYPEILISY